VTHRSLTPIHGDVNLTKEGTTACKFWGLGSDGTVGANKSAIKIIGDKTDMYAQAYFAYDSKKSGGITMSHLRFGKSPIISPYLINKADFISCSQQSYVRQYDLLAGLKKGGKFLLNTVWSDEELNTHLPASMKRYIAQNEIEFYTVNAVQIARELGLGGRFNMVMQSGFFKLANIIPIEDAVKYLKDAVVSSYGSKGEKVVNMNNGAIDHGIESLHRVNVPAEWKDAVDEEVPVNTKTPEFITKIQNVMNRQEGDKLKISELLSMEDGTFPVGGTAFEKRGTAISVPVWRPEKCIQCNQCAYVCPHAAIRPFVLDEEEQKGANFPQLKAQGKTFAGMNFRIQVDVLDCTGCSNCVDVCPGKKGEKALGMKHLETQMDQVPNWNYCVDHVKTKQHLVDTKANAKNSQFATPLFEFSGACAGCGETPYVKLVTQLYGDREMVVAFPRAPRPLPPVRGDRDLVFLAIYNVVSNAVKYSSPGATLEVRGMEERGHVVVDVSDTGRGLPASGVGQGWGELARSKEVRHIPGNGLGLPMVAAVLRRLGGSCELSSIQGRGTTVRMRLPLL